jgi:glucose-6-phosphate isomerase
VVLPPLPPLDARDPAALWQRFRSLLWHDADLGIWLDISRMAVSQSDLDELAPRFAKAFTALEALEAGAIANPDE